MERLVLLVLFFFKGGKRGNEGVQQEPFFCDCLALWQILVHCMILSSACLTQTGGDT